MGQAQQVGRAGGRTGCRRRSARRSPGPTRSSSTAWRRRPGDHFQAVGLAADAGLHAPDQAHAAHGVDLRRQGQHRLQRPLARQAAGGGAGGGEEPQARSSRRLAAWAAATTRTSASSSSCGCSACISSRPARVALHPLDDAAHHRHRLFGIVAGRALGRQHDRVGAPRRRRWRRPRPRPGSGSASWSSTPASGWRRSPEDAAFAGGAQDDLLGHRHLFRGHLDAQVAAGDHDAVAEIEDRDPALPAACGFSILASTAARPSTMRRSSAMSSGPARTTGRSSRRPGAGRRPRSSRSFGVRATSGSPRPARPRPCVPTACRR